MSAEIDAIARQSQPSLSRGAQVTPAPRQVSVHPAVKPLIITEWNQGNSDNVYNAHLPQISGKYPCTGCVATAGAQIMYYYRWPKAATKSVPGYSTSSKADTSKDLPSITFRWDKMKTQYYHREVTDPLTDAEEAVADLMLYCGYAAEMQYGLNGSGASVIDLARGMSEYFDYNPNTWNYVERSNYSISDWDDLIYNELASGRPIIYSGSSFQGGHSFICDGYDGAGMYHFNWGWGGEYNGYFKLQATNPYGKSDISDIGYVMDNYCIIGLQPSSWPVPSDPSKPDEWDVADIEGVVATADNVRVDGLKVLIALGNENNQDVAFGFGMGELNADGSISPVSTEYELYKEWGEISKGLYYSNVSFDFSTFNLSEGSHILVPISLVNGESVWRRCKPADIYFEVNVRGGTKTLVAHPVENLKISKFDLASGGTPGNNQAVNFTVTNNGDNIERLLYVYVGTANDKGYNAARKTVKIASGNTKTYNLSIGWLEQGSHTLYLTSGKDGAVLAKTEVIVAQDISATSFNVSGAKFANSELQVDVTVENHAGDFALPLYLFASKTTTKNRVYAAGTAIERGGSEVVTFYFKPTEVGRWNLWVATDDAGSDVIGQSTVDITEAPTGKVTLKSSNSNAVFGRNSDVTCSFTAKNTGTTTNYRNLETWLYVWNSGSGIGVKNVITPLTLQSGEENTVSIYFDGLEEGVGYRVITYYYTTFNGTDKIALNTQRFTYTKPVFASLGDANDDNTINAADIVEVVNYIMGSPSAKFNKDGADANDDGTVNAADIVSIVNIIMGQ